MQNKVIRLKATAAIKEALPHLLVTALLMVLDPQNAWLILIVGVVYPDFIVLIYKIFYRLNFYKVRKLSAIVHLSLVPIALIALILGFPYVFAAGLAHLFLDFLGL